MLSAPHTVLYLVDYMIWADSELLSACAQLTQEELHRDLGCSHTCVFGTLQHMFIANYDWLARLRHSMTSDTTEISRALLFPSADPGPDLPGLSKLWATAAQNFRQYVETLEEREFAGEITTLGRRISRQTLILHVCNHATLHRGQVVGMFRQLGHRPPSTDLSTYHWGP
jgi:uncharacterized damage-inducible protein DinB